MSNNSFTNPLYNVYDKRASMGTGLIIEAKNCTCVGGSVDNEKIAEIAQKLVDEGIAKIPADKYLTGIELDAASKLMRFNIEGAAAPLTVYVGDLLSDKANSVDVYSKSEADDKFQIRGNYLTEHQSLEGYATEEYVSNVIKKVTGTAPEALDTLGEIADKLNSDSDAIKAINSVLEGKAAKEDVYTKDEADSKFLTEHQSLDAYALKSELHTPYDDTEIKARVATLEGIDHTKFLTEHQDLSEYAKKNEIPEAYNDTDIKKRIGDLEAIDHSQFLTAHQDISNLATKDEIPSIEGLVSEDYVNTEVAKKQDKGNYLEFSLDSEDPQRKIINLNNADLFMARANTEPLDYKVDITGGVTLLQLNKWNVVDLGSNKTITNINTPDGQRPTVQEKSQSGPEAHKIAYLDDLDAMDNTISNVDALKATIATMEAKFTMLNNKYQELSKTAVEVKTEFNGGDELSDSAVDYIIESPALTAPTKIVGKSVEMKNATITLASEMESSIKRSPVAIEAKDVKIDGLAVTGSFDTNLNSNAVVTINNAAFAEIKDAVFDGENLYNGIEIGLANNSAVLPKNIVFDNCHFKNYFTHNAFSIFRMQDDATITLNNCRFDDIVGVMRITNSTNAKNITININNCVLNNIEHNIGLIMFQDNVSENASAFYETNMFGDGKIVVNINNLIANGEKVVGNLVGLGAKPCAVNVYANGVKYLSYEDNNLNYFPVVNVQ